MSLKCHCCIIKVALCYNNVSWFLQEMDHYVLDEAFLTLHHLYRQTNWGHVLNVQPPGHNESMRWSAYTLYTLLSHGRLGQGNRIVVPACVVRRIRTCFPNPLGHYTGYRLGYNKFLKKVDKCSDSPKKIAGKYFVVSTDSVWAM